MFSWRSGAQRRKRDVHKTNDRYEVSRGKKLFVSELDINCILTMLKSPALRPTLSTKHNWKREKHDILPVDNRSAISKRPQQHNPDTRYPLLIIQYGTRQGPEERDFIAIQRSSYKDVSRSSNNV
jgi:hypothetical protein